MKNLLIYISPNGTFNNPSPRIINDGDLSIKVQIENSLRLGWKVEDILLFTNFEFQYSVVKASVLKDVEYVEWQPQASKINAIIKLFENGLIKNNELYWFHDLDTFQLLPITESELKLEAYDMALTDYHIPNRWSTSSFFFKIGSRDIFYRTKEIMYKRKFNEEKALQELTDMDENIRKRVKKLNLTYNFSPFIRPPIRYETALKPLRVAHFHPLIGIPTLGMMWAKGIHRNSPLIPDRLIKIFNYHGIR